MTSMAWPDPGLEHPNQKSVLEIAKGWVWYRRARPEPATPSDRFMICNAEPAYNKYMSPRFVAYVSGLIEAQPSFFSGGPFLSRQQRVAYPMDPS